jgi:hypothetical protein
MEGPYLGGRHLFPEKGGSHLCRIRGEESVQLLHCEESPCLRVLVRSRLVFRGHRLPVQSGEDCQQLLGRFRGTLFAGASSKRFGAFCSGASSNRFGTFCSGASSNRFGAFCYGASCRGGLHAKPK